MANSPVSSANREQRRHPDEFVDFDGAAEHLGVSPRLVRRLWAERRITATKISPRTVRFRISDLDAYAARHRVEASR